MSRAKIEDRIGCYLMPRTEEFLFDELSDSYLDRAGIADILMGVPIPIRKTAMTSLTTLDIARNMAFIIGCDPNFDYAENYIAYILRTFGKKFAEGLVGDGVDGAKKQDYDYACIQFRAAMQIDPENVDALYCYGRACKDTYELGEEEELVGRYKAESLEAFEQVTLRRPDFADAFYFLGYGYVNLGLYVKAKLTWEEYMKLTDAAASAAVADSTVAVGNAAASAAADGNDVASGNDSAAASAAADGNAVASAAAASVADGNAAASAAAASTAVASAAATARAEELRKCRQEIRQRIESLTEPVEIEKGYNLILSGRYQEGIEKLSQYEEGKFADWWPLWYYLGVAYNQLAQLEGRQGTEEQSMLEEAAAHFQKVLLLSPSNIETMEELVKLYRKLGQPDKVSKYEKKIAIVKANAEMDRTEARATAEAQSAPPTPPNMLN